MSLADIQRRIQNVQRWTYWTFRLFNQLESLPILVIDGALEYQLNTIKTCQITFRIVQSIAGNKTESERKSDQ